MKFFYALILMTLTSPLLAFAVDQNQIQQWVLESVDEMPKGGGYELTAKPPRQLRDAFTWQDAILSFDPKVAVPSYCTSATYSIFYKVLQKYWTQTQTQPSVEALQFLKPNVDADGVRGWGRWNSNGPGTSKLFFDTGLGKNFSNIEEALPGDFLKIFWNGFIGKREKGHTVIYLGSEIIKGVRMITFWSSNKDTGGYGVRTIPESDAVRMIFSRLEHPENASELARLEEKDLFLESMLSKDSSWEEVRQVSGF